jgi:hypothetical protein
VKVASEPQAATSHSPTDNQYPRLAGIAKM